MGIHGDGVRSRSRHGNDLLNGKLRNSRSKAICGGPEDYALLWVCGEGGVGNGAWVGGTLDISLRLD